MGMTAMFAVIVLGVAAVGAGIGFLLYRYARARIERQSATAALVASDARELLPTPGGQDRLASRLNEIGGPVATAVRKLMRQRAPEPGKCARLAKEVARGAGGGWSRAFTFAATGLAVLFFFFSFLSVLLGMPWGCEGTMTWVLALPCVLVLRRLHEARQRWEVRLCECLTSIDEALRKEGL